MKKSKLFFLIIFVTTILGCESQMTIAVTCVDSESKQPIEGVHVLVEAGKNGDYTKAGQEGFTGEDGRFDASMMIGCAFGCYDIYITYTKEGYQTKKDFNILEGRVDLIKEK